MAQFNANILAIKEHLDTGRYNVIDVNAELATLFKALDAKNKDTPARKKIAQLEQQVADLKAELAAPDNAEYQMLASKADRYKKERDDAVSKAARYKKERDNSRADLKSIYVALNDDSEDDIDFNVKAMLRHIRKLYNTIAKYEDGVEEVSGDESEDESDEESDESEPESEPPKKSKSKPSKKKGGK